MPEQPSLVGPRARLDRADILIAELDATTKAFAATKPYKAVQVDDPNPLNRRFVIEAVGDVPLAIRVRAGEIVHNTRASLDLLHDRDHGGRLARCESHTTNGARLPQQPRPAQ
jgi:hypothetical protein